MTLFVCYFLPVKSIKVSRVSAPVPVLLSFFLLLWSFIFAEKSYCDITFTSKIHLVLSVTSIITMLVILLQMIYGYVTICVVSVSLSLCLFLCDVWKIYFTHHIGPHFSGTKSSCCYGELVKGEGSWKKKIKGEPQDIFSRKTTI